MKKGKSKGKGAQAHAPVSRALAISADTEAKVRSLLKDLPDTPARSSKAQLSRKTLQQRYVKAYESLRTLGFKEDDIQAALKSVPPGDVTMETALDWLCLHIPNEQLPTRFRSSMTGSTSKEVKLIRRAEEEAQCSAPAAEARNPGEEVVLLPVATSRKSEVAEVNKSWILQQYGGGGPEQEEDEEDTQESSDSEIADWEIWGDPQEVARRRHERAMAKVPVEVRRHQLLEELSRAKAYADLAKSRSDKSRQKEAGMMIRDIKVEMEKLGISEEMVQEVMAKPRGITAEAEKERREPEQNVEVHTIEGVGDETSVVPEGLLERTWDQEDEGTPSGTTRDSMGPVVGVSGGQNRDPGTETVEALPHADDIEASWDLFDNNIRDTSSSPAAETPAAPAPLPALSSLVNRPARQPKLKKRAPASSPAAPAKPPLAQLQQYCQKMTWKAPRLERLPLGQGADEGYLYNITLEPLKILRGAAARRSVLPGPRTFFLPNLRGTTRGWPSIAEAQNAIAARVLYELGKGDVDLLTGPLGNPWEELWGQWKVEDDKKLSQPEQAEMESEIDGLEAFVNELVEDKARENGVLPEEEAGPPGPHTTGDDVDDWEATVLDQELEQDVRMDKEKLEEEKNQKVSRQLLSQLNQWWSSEEGQRWKSQRDQLPIADARAQVLNLLEEKDVLVVSGETGSGKTTQVPQYILEQATQQGRGGMCNVICTQPRRIAAISVAERVANERGEPPPGTRDAASTVGYHVRLDAASTSHTRLLFCTTGILLRRLSGDPLLMSVSHVVVDEVHERTMQGDFLMALLRELQAQRRAKGHHPLKVVLMSATLDTTLFSEYFGGCPVVAVGGRTHPVEHHFLEDIYDMVPYVLAADSRAARKYHGRRGTQKYRKQVVGAGARSKQQLIVSGWGDDEGLEEGPLNPEYDPDLYVGYGERTRKNLSRLDEEVIDYDLLEELVAHIDQHYDEGAILVFLPGMSEITRLHNQLSAQPRFGRGASRQWLLPLHSSLSPAEQRRAFLRPPAGVRKVVIATDIAETSLTIGDVVYVVDSGRHKERRYNANKHMSMLVEDWVSQASANQRKGRAGRVQPGHCFSLFTLHRYEQRLKRYGTPEISRVPLEELVLQIQAMQLGRAQEFLARVLQPPPEKAVLSSVLALQQMGALDGDEKLTALGRHLAQLPVDPRLGKLLVLSAPLGCLGPALTLCAVMSHKSPFESGGPGGDENVMSAKKMLAQGQGPSPVSLCRHQQSDHMVVVAAYDLWRSTCWLEKSRAAGARVARQYKMSEQILLALSEMRKQFALVLVDINFIPVNRSAERGGAVTPDPPWCDDISAPWNRHSTNPLMLRALLCAALSPNVAILDEGASQGRGTTMWRDASGDEVFIHPSSVNHDLAAKALHYPYLVYLEKVKTSKVFLRDCSVISPMSLLLLGTTLKVVHEEGFVVVDEWIRVRAPAQTSVLVKQLRSALVQLLEVKIQRPTLEWGGAESRVLDTIAELLGNEERGRRIR